MSPIVARSRRPKTLQYALVDACVIGGVVTAYALYASVFAGILTALSISPVGVGFGCVLVALSGFIGIVALYCTDIYDDLIDKANLKPHRVFKSSLIFGLCAPLLQTVAMVIVYTANRSNRPKSEKRDICRTITGAYHGMCHQ